MKKQCSHLQVSTHRTTVDSFRRGGCSFASQLGISRLLIKLRGDWKFNAYEHYAFISDTMSIKLAKVL